MERIKVQRAYSAMTLCLICSLLLGLAPITLRAADNESYQQPKKTVTASGYVKDTSGKPMTYVTVYLKGNSKFGTVTDVNGYFELKNIPHNSMMIFSSLGYTTQELDLSTKTVDGLKNLTVTLLEGGESIEDVVVTATGAQKKVSVVGSITTIETGELRAPTRSLTTELAGRVSGVTFSQQSGQPGKDGASFIIRGINSLAGNTSPLILIDGLKRTLDDVDANDIESFAILKDASATAVYGLEGANGIIVITTKSGKNAERPQIRVSLSSSANTTTYRPDWCDAVEYANMRNEANLARDKRAYYTDEEIAMFGDKNMNLYPNIDWYKQLIKPVSLAEKANFNISGGSNVVTYYMSAGYYTEDGMYNSGNDSNANYNQFNFRSNLKADITKTTTLGIGMDGRYGTTTEPGQSVASIQEVMNNINPTLFPAEYPNGMAPEEPVGTTNPWSMLTKTGFKKDYANYFSTNVNLVQKLDFITEGLYANAIASFTKDNYYTHKYVKRYQQHSIDTSYFSEENGGIGWDDEGNFHTINKTPDTDDKMSFESTKATGSRVIEFQASVNYARQFGDWFTSALVLYKQRETLTDVPGGDGAKLLINALAAREQSIAGRATVDYKHRYFMDVNFGASGSQYFTPKNRWSMFPSVGLGWLVSEEPFWKPIKKVVDFLKLRATVGSVGAPGSATRFGYMATTANINGYTFGYGNNGGTYITGVGEQTLEQLGLTWERNNKYNAGLELGLFGHFKLIADAYKYVNQNQLVSLSYIPSTLGLPSTPKANLGETQSKGIDLDLTYSQRWGDFSINYIKAIVGYTANKIIENGQVDPKVPYQSGIGLDYGRSLIYVAQGLFEDQNDIDNSPVQTWNSVMPGDIKYKDIDGDGVITAQDRIWLGNAYPKWNYSLAVDMSYKNWIFSTRFIGKGDMYRFISGGRIPFNSSISGNDQGALYMAAYNDHYTPATISGTTATERLDATYPRLAYGSDNINNAQSSTFWMRKASYLRWQDIELGYNLVPRKSIGIKSIYIYGRCENICTFSPFKDWNPEQTSSYSYPLKRTFTLGLEIGLGL